MIAANDLWRDKLIARKSVNPDKCTSLLNFPDQTIFKSNGSRAQRDKFRIIYPGTLSWHQGVDIAIRAFALICEAAPHVEFHIFGDGHARESLMI